MANVRGFNDLNSQPNVRTQTFRPSNNNTEDNYQSSSGTLGFGNDEPLTQEQITNAERHKVLFVSGRAAIKNPREQTYCDMLVETFCPVFRCLSLTVFILLLDIAVFIAEVSVGLKRDGQFLQVKADTLLTFGANYAPKVLLREVWRLVAAIGLHIHFMHLISNTIATLIFITRLEYTFGWWRTLIIYVVSGIGGNIFSIVVEPEAIKAGASTSLYGAVGIIVSYIFINWNGLDLIGRAMKCRLVTTAIMIFLFILIFTSATSSSIDYFGHLGGFLTGLWLACIHTPIIETSRQKNIRIVFGCLCVLQLIICFLIFFLRK